MGGAPREQRAPAPEGAGREGGQGRQSGASLGLLRAAPFFLFVNKDNLIFRGKQTGINMVSGKGHDWFIFLDLLEGHL